MNDETKRKDGRGKCKNNARDDPGVIEISLFSVSATKEAKVNGRERKANARRSSSVLPHAFFASFGARRFTRIVSPSARRSADHVLPTLRERECMTHGVDAFVATS